jgi:hypothetical protein
LYQAFRDAPHSRCLAVASLIAFRLTIRMKNLRILRSPLSSRKWRRTVQTHVTPAPSNADFLYEQGTLVAGLRLLGLGSSIDPTAGDCRLQAKGKCGKCGLFSTFARFCIFAFCLP